MPAVPLLPLTLRSVNHQLVRRYRCEANWRCHLRLRDFDLWYVAGGRGTLSINGEVLAIAAPQICVFCPGDEVLGEHQPSSPLDVYAFHFLTVENETEARRALLQLQGMRPTGVAQIHELWNLLVDSAVHGDPLGQQQRVHLGTALLTLLWRDLHNQALDGHDWRIQSLITQIRRRPEEPWSVPQMAQSAGLSASHLTKRFRRLTGLPPQQFVIHTRLQHACRLMAEPHLSLAQIADASGYRDVYFFSRQFKAVKGESPSAFRRRHGMGTVSVDR